MPVLLPLLLGASPAAIAVLPVEAPELPPEAARAAAEGLARALPAPFTALALDARTVREHLAAAGPGCRADLACLCRAAGLAPEQLALDLSLVPAGGGRFWAADLRLLSPCTDGAIDRRGQVLPAGELQPFLDWAAGEMLRGRDLPERPGPAAPARVATPPAAPPRSEAEPGAPPPASAEASFASLLRDGRALLAGGQYAQAVEKLDAALALRPGAYDALVARGHARLGLQALTAALADYESAHQAEPGRAMALVGLAEASARMGRRADALRWYRAALTAPLDDLPDETRTRAQTRADALSAEGTR